jgi:molybdopterin-guanine dinucleotide biosynthesis protein A
MIENITGVVLAGGKSTRMGREKALLPYRGKNLIDAPIETLSAVFSNVVLSVKDSNDLPQYSRGKIVDQHTSIGPIGGITSVLKILNQKIFCAACDMPFLNQALIEFICSVADADAVIPIWQGRPEVLHALYSPALIPSLENAIVAGRYKITDALGNSNIRFIEEEAIKKFDPTGASFQNVNTLSDYEKM